MSPVPAGQPRACDVLPGMGAIVTEREQLERGIAALESLRGVLGDAVVDIALAPLRARLAALGTPEQQLKVVTILFTDVVGSTTLSQPLDPEDIHAIMDGALQHLTAIVESQYGRVLQYAGDSLLAVFGANETHEHDPERAVRAGLAILEEARRLALHVQEHHGRDGFNVRVGIHTGPVLLGGGVDAEGSIRGIAVNIAARMEQTAPVGGLRISHSTYRHIRGLFEVSEEPPLLVKGIADPMRSYLVLRSKPRAFHATNRVVDGIETRMVGREAEFAKLTETFEAVVAKRTLSLVTIVADAGLGKSRLMLEFEHWLDLRPEAVGLFHGRAQPYSSNVPYGLLRDLLAWRFEILDSDTQAAAQVKLAKGFRTLFGDRTQEQTALIGQLIGLDYSASPHISGIAGDGKQIRNRAFHAAAQYFRLIHQDDRAPIVLLLDDVHWADDGSLDFVDHIAHACHDLPLMVLCLTRPPLYQRRPLWGSGTDHHERIDLAPLSGPSSRELVESLLSRLETVPAPLRDVLTGNAEGNPYFVEELVAMLIDDGVIVTGQDQWRLVADNLIKVRVPSTLAGVLQARLDGLPPTAKIALQQASVIGHVFWDEPLRRMAPAAPQALDVLMRRDLVRARDTSTFEGVREYVFKHHLLHEVTYNSVLKRDKREQHRLAAEWLVATSGERAHEHHGLIADHYERAGDPVSAAIYLRRAGEAAASAYATGVALDYLDRALRLTSTQELGLRFELITSRVHLLHLTGRRLEEEAEVRALEELAETLNDDAKRAGAAGVRARFAVFTADYPASASAAARAVALAETAGVARIAQFARSVWASALLAQRDYAGARALAEQLLLSTRADGNHKREIDALHLLGNLAGHDGRYGKAREYFEQALQLAKSTSNTLFESIQLHNLGSVEHLLGNYGAALDRLQTGLTLCRTVGAVELQAHFLGELAEVTNACGDSMAALDYIAQARVVAREILDRNREAVLMVAQGDAQSALGQLVDAAVSYREAVAIYREVGRSSPPPEPLAGLARVALALGNIDEALIHADDVEALIDAGPHASSNQVISDPTMYSCTLRKARAGPPDFIASRDDPGTQQVRHSRGRSGAEAPSVPLTAWRSRGSRGRRRRSRHPYPGIGYRHPIALQAVAAAGVADWRHGHLRLRLVGRRGCVDWVRVDWVRRVGIVIVWVRER